MNISRLGGVYKGIAMACQDAVLREVWDAEDALSMAVLDCAVAGCCYPCVYGAGLDRHCSEPPTQPRPVCDCTAVCCLGSLLPPITGVVVRAQQHRGSPAARAAAVARAFVVETCCCVCAGAPCSMNDYRLEVPLNVGRLLLEPQPGDFVAVDGYIAPKREVERAQSSPACRHGSSPATAAGSSPSPPSSRHPRPASAVATLACSTADPSTRL